MKIIPNPDKEVVTAIREALKKNNGYCPCSLIKSADTQCPCKDFRQSKVEELCHCGLYMKIKE